MSYSLNPMSDDCYPDTEVNGYEETKLDEADKAAEQSAVRLSADEVFGRIKRHIHIE